MRVDVYLRCVQDGSGAAAEDVVAAQKDVAHHHHHCPHPGAGHLPQHLLGRWSQLLQEQVVKGVKQI